MDDRVGYVDGELTDVVVHGADRTPTRLEIELRRTQKVLRQPTQDLRAGELDRAQGYLTRAQDELATQGERWPEPVIWLAEAEVRSAEGAEPDVVRALLEKARDVATEQGTHAMARRMERAIGELGGA